MEIISCHVASSSLLSAYELAKATEYLASTRDSLFEALNGMSDSQWYFEPAPGCWSVAGIVEHLVLIEDRVHAVVGQMQNAPPADPDRVNSEVEEIILTAVPKRSTKLQAPPPVLPSQLWSLMEARRRFHQSRTRTIELLVEAPCLRGHLVPHPFLGAWDGYQWILAAAAHSARHTDQILEVKASPAFPESAKGTEPCRHKNEESGDTGGLGVSVLREFPESSIH